MESWATTSLTHQMKLLRKFIDDTRELSLTWSIYALCNRFFIHQEVADIMNYARRTVSSSRTMMQDETTSKAIASYMHDGK